MQMSKKDKLIIVGTAAFAEIAFEYFTHDSKYEVVAFSVEKDFIIESTLFDKPVVEFESIEESYPPTEYNMFIAITYRQLNRLRTRLYKQAKRKGYNLVSYVSSKAFVWKNVELGENCFIFEDNTIQPFVKIGNNVIFWSGNHIGHHSIINDNCFISSHVVISGFCEIGENCFFGVNSTLSNNLKIGKDCVISAGALVMRDTDERTLYKINASRGENFSKGVFTYFKLTDLEELFQLDKSIEKLE